MADEQSSDDKTEDATPHRIQKAREEGQVPRSRELATFLLLGGGAAGLWLLAGPLGDTLERVLGASFGFDRAQALDSRVMLANALMLGQEALLALLPLFALLMVLALVGPVLLGGWMFSTKSLAPSLGKLNPVKGLGRMVSSQALAELLKTIAKSILVGGVVVMYLHAQRQELMALMMMPLGNAMADALAIVARCTALAILMLIVPTLMDVPYQLWSHAKKLRMSLEEIKREHKETDGDPQIKARIRQQQQAMARARMMSAVPTADVIVNNPTHYSVALVYHEGDMRAPRVVAKGRDEVALRIREVGEANEVPMLSAPPLARALHTHVDLEQEIPIALYQVIAEVLAWAMRLKRARQQGGLRPSLPADLSVPDEYQVSEETQGAAEEAGPPGAERDDRAPAAEAEVSAAGAPPSDATSSDDADAGAVFQPSAKPGPDVDAPTDPRVGS
ncbi:flagellar biosynthesis protein FlhB [Cobetia sp. 29-18-1]|uniref:flagellar biosynthesis protein FlhB n=1 Tax=Cobetia sp. 29-18-1 TaxID=3040018 RepID=UPI00244B6AFD|nr:flagellar biosynthesis protein FlhB [Cobetia sp. 29-18-1]MDH2299071.1 flagellar biosynthesis protein FlhB [Cobetia sp. 29-18-1]